MSGHRINSPGLDLAGEVVGGIFEVCDSPVFLVVAALVALVALCVWLVRRVRGAEVVQ
jgi:hypothetical protein